MSILNAGFVRGVYDPRADHIKERIVGSIFFDIDAISDDLSPLPNMLPN